MRPRETQAKKKMGSSKEMLRSDIRTIHGALEEVLNCARPDVPSWRFPGRLSASLSLEDVLGPSEEQERASLLEGIVDRLLLLLQASLKLWTEAEEQRPSHPLPLSLSSAVRKFCRQLLQTRRKTQSLQTQLSARDEQVSSLTVALERAQDQVQLLQSSLDHATSSSHLRPGSVLSSVVPYEARSTLRIGRLASVQSSRQSSRTNIHEPSTPQPATPFTQSSVWSPQLMTNSDQTGPKCTTVSTQTAETSFAMCVRCSYTLKTLTSTAGKLQELCQSLHLSSRLSDSNWDMEAEVGTLDPGRWSEAVGSDLDAIRRAYETKEEELVSLTDTLVQQKCREEKLQSKLNHVSLQMSDLQDKAAESERNHAMELASCREAGSVGLREVEGALRSVQEHRDTLEDQLTSVKMERDKLIASSADIEKQQQSLERELLEVRERERSLRGGQRALESQLKRLQVELVQCKEQLETDRLQLSKATSLHQSLQRKHQARLSRQREVLGRLEEMDREVEDLRRELASTTRTRDQILCRVEELQSECSSLQRQVAEHEEKSVASAREQERLCEELLDLELRLTSLSAELEKERENCRLLVTHPENGSSSGRDLHKHITANTIRILLLEEQNTEMREAIVEKARQTTNGENRKKELMQPVPLWHSSSLVSVLLGPGKLSDSHLAKPPPRPSVAGRLT